MAITLNETQAIYVRELLYEELHEAAEMLATQAADAAQGNAAAVNVAGDDAHGTWRQRLQVTAELLDTVGWSVTTDTATIVALEQRRREESAA
jgi:predicted secreted protein